MKKLLAGLLLFLLLPMWVASATAETQVVRLGQGDELFAQIEQLLTELKEITGLEPLKKIDYAMIDKAHVKKFLDDRIREYIKPEEIRAEELTLKKFGFVPQDYDLAKATVELMTEQAAALYDFRKKKLFVIESAPDALQQIALVHELAHALADQHFNLEKYVDLANQSDDSATARMAVMEGQATWLMSEYLARRTGQSLSTSPAILRLMSGAAEMAQGQFPVFDAAPLYMRETLLFPYSKGMLFQHAVYEKYGKKAFSEVFRNPPVSSQQILHPEKYFEGAKPTEPALQSVPSEKEFKELTEGYVGELDHAILLRQYAGQDAADSISTHWKGGRYKLLEHKKDRRAVLCYASEWDTAQIAKAYFAHYQTVLKKKWKCMVVTSDADGAVKGKGDDGYFVLRLNGTQVTSIEGLESPDEAVGVLR
ncbi:MAG: hypothetical protein ABFD60_00590 [Bryobacteraceae bacterium]